MIQPTQIDLSDGKDFHRRNISWVRYLKDLESGPIYKNRIDEWIAWLDKPNDFGVKPVFETKEDAIEGYFQDMHEKGYAASTLFGWWSIFVKYWEMTKQGNLKTRLPIIEPTLKKWAKAERIKKANVFTEEQQEIFRHGKYAGYFGLESLGDNVTRLCRSFL